MLFEFAAPSTHDVQEPITFQDSDSSEPGLAEYIKETYFKIASMNLTGKTRNDMIAIILDVLKFYKNTNKKWIEEEMINDPKKILDLTFESVYCSLTSAKIMYTSKKALAMNRNYVEPREVSIGTRYEQKKKHFMVALFKSRG